MGLTSFISARKEALEQLNGSLFYCAPSSLLEQLHAITAFVPDQALKKKKKAKKWEPVDKRAEIISHSRSCGMPGAEDGWGCR